MTSQSTPISATTAAPIDHIEKPQPIQHIHSDIDTMHHDGTLPHHHRETSHYEPEFDTQSWASTPCQSAAHTPPSSCCPSETHYDTPPLSRRDDDDHPLASLSFDLINTACDQVGHMLQEEVGTLYRPAPVSSPFDAQTEPKITVPAYFERIRHYSQATPETILCSIVLLRRACEDSSIKLCAVNIHRMLVAAVMVFAKFYDDEIDSNCRWARIAGIKKCEINNLEIELLNRCQFDLRVSSQAFHDIVAELVCFSRRQMLLRESVDTECSIAIEECPAPVPIRARKSHMSVFHVSRREGKRSSSRDRDSRSRSGSVTSEGFSKGKPPKSGVMSFFHPTPHAHLQCPFRSPDTMHLGSPGSVSCASNPASPRDSSTPTSPREGSQSTATTPSSTPRTGMPRSVSMQSIASLLHRGSPAVFGRKGRSHVQCEKK